MEQTAPRDRLHELLVALPLLRSRRVLPRQEPAVPEGCIPAGIQGEWVYCHEESVHFFFARFLGVILPADGQRGEIAHSSHLGTGALQTVFPWFFM